MKPKTSKPNAKMQVLRLILSLMIAWAIHWNANSQNPTATKPNGSAIRHVTISELTARNALKYKADAEYFYQQSALKDTIIWTQDTIIAKQKKKITWKNVENWAWRGLAIITAFKLLKAN
jgi:hypothetical protein